MYGVTGYKYTFPANNGTTCTMTANWNINQNTLVVDANGGSGGGTWKQNYGTTKGVSVSRGGHDFTGWTTSGTCNTIGSGASFTYTYPSNNGTTCTIKANWKAHSSGGGGGGGGGCSGGTGCWCGCCDSCAAEHCTDNGGSWDSGGCH